MRTILFLYTQCSISYRITFDITSQYEVANLLLYETKSLAYYIALIEFIDRLFFFFFFLLFYSVEISLIRRESNIMSVPYMTYMRRLL